MLIAITRQISPRFDECELTHLDRQPIDLDLAREQHQQYEAALRELGCEVISLSAESRATRFGVCGRRGAGVR